MNGWFNPDNWLDLVSQILLIAGGIAIAVVPSWFAARTHQSLKTETKVIRDQLVNGHTTFLRNDVDKALSAIENLTREITNLRNELFVETDSRRRQIDDLHHDVDRMRRDNK